MLQKLKDKTTLIALIYTIASALFIIGMSSVFFTEERLIKYQYNVGIDSLGALVCAALLYGSMKQKGDGSKIFRILIVLVCTCFTINEVMIFTANMPEYRNVCFVFCMLSKLVDLALIFLFYLYVRATLGVEGKFANFIHKLLPILLIVQTIIQLSNIIAPVTFSVTAEGVYQDTSIVLLEELFLLTASVLTTILIFRSHNPASQKAALLTFVFLPIIEYAILGGSFGEASQYGVVLMSLIVMYCVVFIEKSKTLASTQTDLAIASKIQEDALPPVAPEFEDFPDIILRGSMNTAKEVGGDFYDYFPIDENRICFLIADVSGKGTPAALFMMTAKTMIKDYALTHDNTSEIFTSVNARLCENNEAGMFATAWIGILDKRTMILQYTNAGHNYPYIQRKDKPCELLNNKHGLFLAGMDFTKYKQSEIKLEPGDTLLLYTDGVTEAHDKTKTLYREERLARMLEKTRDSSGEEVLDSIFKDINVFAEGVPQFDDITMVILKVKE